MQPRNNLRFICTMMTEGRQRAFHTFQRPYTNKYRDWANGRDFCTLPSSSSGAANVSARVTCGMLCAISAFVQGDRYARCVLAVHSDSHVQGVFVVYNVQFGRVDHVHHST